MTCWHAAVVPFAAYDIIVSSFAVGGVVSIASARGWRQRRKRVFSGPVEADELRELDTIDQMHHVAGVVGRGLFYRDLVADNGQSAMAA